MNYYPLETVTTAPCEPLLPKSIKYKSEKSAWRAGRCFIYIYKKKNKRCPKLFRRSQLRPVGAAPFCPLQGLRKGHESPSGMSVLWRGERGCSPPGTCPLASLGLPALKRSRLCPWREEVKHFGQDEMERPLVSAANSVAATARGELFVWLSHWTPRHARGGLAFLLWLQETEAQECYITCMGIIHPGSGCVETHTGIISL